ncbi:MAG: DNA-binding domain-containing protein [Methylomonas sp.]|jgi:hypothetical protein
MSNQAITLSELQQAFQSAILHLRDTPPNFVVDTRQASAADRFTVYTEAYRLRLIEALGADYPVLQDLLDDEGFNVMCRAYIDASPSDQFSIRWFGRHLPGFLTKTPPYLEQAGIAELAAFEWALSEAFDAPESTLADYNRLAAIEPPHWPSLTLKFHPSLRRLDLHYNAPEVWQASNRQETLPNFIENIELQAWIIWRQQLKLLFRSLSAQEAFALDAFLQGQCFAEVCSGLSEWLDEEKTVISAAGFLQTWLRDGWIADVATIS